MNQRLKEDEYEELLKSLPGWEIEGGQLKRVFKFESYPAGVDFAVKCGEIAETMNHHPDLLIQWRKVTVTISTHSCGGLTGLDFDFARQADALIP